MQPNAQGISGLLAQGKAPKQPGAQAPQMPTPQGGVAPISGIGSIDERVKAFRGNPGQLQQRYTMSQDLLDLLALQKIKSEKDAAARQMQLAMAQQQAQQGMQPTVAQQREKEVHDLTKNELAQQRGDTANQQQNQQQEAMQRAIQGGVASAPGANLAAQPAAMAAGGIVGFNGEERSDVPAADGEDEYEFDPVTGEYRKAEPKRTGLLDRLLGFMNWEKGSKAQVAPPETKAAIQKVLDARNGVKPQPAPQAAPSPGVTGAVAEQKPQPAPPVQPTPPRPQAQRPPVAGIPTALPTPAKMPPNPAPTQGGIDSLVAPDTVGLDAYNKRTLAQDPQKVGQAEESRLEGKLGYTPEERAAIDQGIAQRQKLFDEMYDPERMRRESIKEFLLGAGGKRWGELGSGAAASRAYDKSQQAQKLKDFQDLRTAIESPINQRRANTLEAAKMGSKASEVFGDTQGKAATAAAKIRDSETQAMVSKASNDINVQIQKMRDASAAQVAGIHAASSKYTANVNAASQNSQTQAGVFRELVKLGEKIEATKFANIDARTKRFNEQMSGFSVGTQTPERQKQIDLVKQEYKNDVAMINAEFNARARDLQSTADAYNVKLPRSAFSSGAGDLSPGALQYLPKNQ